MSKCFTWGKRPEREPNTRSNAETESLALASVSLCVFEASSFRHGEKFLFWFL